MKSEKNLPTYEIKSLNHLGIVAGVIKDLKIIEMIDERLGKFAGENISAGECWHDYQWFGFFKQTDVFNPLIF